VSKESESRRLQMLRRFKRERDGPPPAEVLEAEKVVAQFRKKQTKAKEVVLRLEKPLPNPNLCFECFYIHNRESLMRSKPHPDPNHFDLWKCDCGYEEEREILR
jgi:hypothetical protein